jgi:hypothetical protein
MFHKSKLLAAFVFAGLAWPSPKALQAQTIVVQPYVQAGDQNASSDTKRILWFTDQKPGDFKVEFHVPGGKAQTVTPTRLAIDFPKYEPPGAKKKDENAKKATDKADSKQKAKKTDGEEDEKEPAPPLPPETEQHYFRYMATLPNLPLNSEIRYVVKLGEKTIGDSVFHTLATADKSVRCVLVGDMAQGRPYQREVAYQIGLQKPEFLVALGDIVYPTGRVFHYMSHFWNTYRNVDAPGPKTGSPLMAGTTVYPLMGNHDISAKLASVPDALGAYYFFTVPKNGPGAGPWVTPLDGDPARIAKFKEATQDAYPYIDAYSFDYGPAHFTIINDNPKMKTDDPAYRAWLKSDLAAATGRWKFVCYHMPGFHSSKQHYTDQQIRPLSPVFEEGGVHVTFAGHVHNYQRTMPLQFLPDAKQEKKGRVDGKYILDTTFDGVKNTNPKGVIHVVAGGGGASLYGPGLDKTAEFLKKSYGANYADFTAKNVVDQHSFVVLDLSPERMEMRALNKNGDVLDVITITKPK